MFYFSFSEFTSIPTLYLPRLQIHIATNNCRKPTIFSNILFAILGYIISWIRSSTVFDSIKEPISQFSNMMNLEVPEKQD